MNKYLALSLSFFKTGLFTFGGGLAMLPIIEREMVEKKQWITENEMTDIVAIAEATPGVIAVNMATFVGYKVGKFWGALLATVAVAVPSFLIIFGISFVIDWFLGLEYVGYAFMGIRCAVAILIMRAAFKLFKKAQKNYLSYILMAISITIMLLIPSLSVIYIILFGAFVGLIERIIIINKQKKQEIINQDALPKEDAGDDHVD